jgi:hypothetical protein
MGGYISSVFSGIGEFGHEVANGIENLADAVSITVVTAGSVGAVWAISNSYAMIKSARK